MNKKIKSLLICNSNMFIPTVLTEVLSHPKEYYLVLSDTKNISQFFAFIDIPNIYFIEYGQLEGRFDFIKKRKMLLNQVKQYEIEKVVFFHTEFGGMANWLIKKMSHFLPVKFCKIYDSIPVPRSKKWESVIKYKIREKIMWGVNVDVLEHAYPFPSLPRQFFKDVKAETISMTVDNAIVSKVVSDCMADVNLNGRYVLLTGTVVHDGYYSAQVYTEFVNKLITSIGQEKIISKCHPRYTDLYGLEQQLPQIPSFIPGNVLIDNYMYYIGFESTLLVEAAVLGKTAISLIDLFPPAEEVRKATHVFFDSRLQGKGIILYPKSMEELKEILKLE